MDGNGLGIERDRAARARRGLEDADGQGDHRRAGAKRMARAGADVDLLRTPPDLPHDCRTKDRAACALDALHEPTHHGLVTREDPELGALVRARSRLSRRRERLHAGALERRGVVALDRRREKAAIRCRELAPRSEELGDRTIWTRPRRRRRHLLRQRFETPPDLAHVAERPAPPLPMLHRQPDSHEPGLADDLEELRAAAVDELGAELDRHRPSTRSARPDPTADPPTGFQDEHAGSRFAELGSRSHAGRSSTHDQEVARSHGTSCSKADAIFLRISRERLLQDTIPVRARSADGCPAPPAPRPTKRPE